MLDQRNDAAGHEPAAADRPPRPRQLNHLDDSAPCRHLDSAPGPGGFNLVGPHTFAGIDDDLDAITLHINNNPPARAVWLRRFGGQPDLAWLVATGLAPMVTARSESISKVANCPNAISRRCDNGVKSL
jgi:hypothetical protein